MAAFSEVFTDHAFQKGANRKVLLFSLLRFLLLWRFCSQEKRKGTVQRIADPDADTQAEQSGLFPYIYVLGFRF